MSFPTGPPLFRPGGVRLQFNRLVAVALRCAMEVLRVGRNTHAAGELEVEFRSLAKICSVMHGAALQFW